MVVHSGRREEEEENAQSKSLLLSELNRFPSPGRYFYTQEELKSVSFYIRVSLSLKAS